MQDFLKTTFYPPKDNKCCLTPHPRPPIDSVETKQDVVGLFNHCVTVKLADGRIIEQNIYPGSTHCQEIFIQSWTMLLNSQWNQVGNKEADP